MAPINNNMKLIVTFGIFLISLSAYAQNRSIKFEKLSFTEALAKAKKENKLIFLDAYTTWCGPCKWMSKNMFTKDEIADYYNAEFVNTKFDMEKGEGLDIAKKYEVRCYPNLLFIDGDGNLVHRTAGASREVKDYIDMGKTAKDPEKRFSKLQNDYASKKNDPVFMAHYIEKLASTCLPMDEHVSTFLSMQDEKDYTSALNWKMIFYYSNNYGSKEFKYLLNNQDKFAKLYTKDSVDMKVSSVFKNAGNRIIYKKNFQEKDYKDLVKQVKDLDFPGSDAVLFHLELSYIRKTGKKSDVMDYAVKNGDKYYTLGELNEISWMIFENSDKKGHLEQAEKWMKRLTDTKQGKNYAYLDTYAAVLYKLKKKDLAKKMAESAIEHAKADGMGEKELLLLTE